MKNWGTVGVDLDSERWEVGRGNLASPTQRKVATSNMLKNMKQRIFNVPIYGAVTREFLDSLFLPDGWVDNCFWPSIHIMSDGWPEVTNDSLEAADLAARSKAAGRQALLELDQ
jgi:hypothetical protein